MTNFSLLFDIDLCGFKEVKHNPLLRHETDGCVLFLFIFLYSSEAFFNN